MGDIRIDDSYCKKLAKRALIDERWLLHGTANGKDRERYIADLAEKIADAVNEELNHYRETLGFDT